MSDRDAAEFLTLYLRGDAMTWWRSFCTTNGGLQAVFAAKSFADLLAELRQEFSDVDIDEDSPLTLKCQLDLGYPKARVLWYKEDLLIKPNEHYKLCKFNILFNFISFTFLLEEKYIE